jgi:hypothetical protein
LQEIGDSSPKFSTSSFSLPLRLVFYVNFLYNKQHVYQTAGAHGDTSIMVKHLDSAVHKACVDNFYAHGDPGEYSAEMEPHLHKYALDLFGKYLNDNSNEPQHVVSRGEIVQHLISSRRYSMIFNL